MAETIKYNYSRIVLDTDNQRILVTHDGGTDDPVQLDAWKSLRTRPDGSGGNNLIIDDDPPRNNHRIQIRIMKDKIKDDNENLDWRPIYNKLIGDNDMRDMLTNGQGQTFEFMWSREASEERLIMMIDHTYIYFAYE